MNTLHGWTEHPVIHVIRAGVGTKGNGDGGVAQSKTISILIFATKGVLLATASLRIFPLLTYRPLLVRAVRQMEYNPWQPWE